MKKNGGKREKNNGKNKEEGIKQYQGERERRKRRGILLWRGRGYGVFTRQGLRGAKKKEKELRIGREK